MLHNSVTIFTDGSSRGNPGPGGFGAVVITDGKVTELGGRETYTTNNRMELQAAISALSIIHNSELVIRMYTDSNYLINGITKWIYGWQKNGWKTGAKKDVENRDLWEQLLNSTIYRTIEWKYIGGHVGIAGKERCDEIATDFADNKEIKLYSGSLSEYGIKHILDIKHDAVAAESKSSNRAHSKAVAYSYVSMINGTIQTHKTWAACEQRVKGKAGARYKKVLTKEGEAELISEWSNAR